MLTDLINTPCTIVTRGATGTVDRYNNPVDGETTTTTVCELQQATRAEGTAAGTIATGEYRLFLLPADELTVDDVVIVDGTRYEVQGTPWKVRGSSGAIDHIEATVVVTGGASS